MKDIVRTRTGAPVIIAPVKRTEEILPILRAGAKEVYGGVMDSAWDEALGQYVEMNRRSAFGSAANLRDCSELCEALGENVLLSREEAKAVNNLTEGYEPDDDHVPDWYSISLPLLKVRGKKNKMLKELSRNVEAAVKLADVYYRSLDDIRYVYYISY